MDDSRLLKVGLLFDVDDVLECVPVHAQAQLELLHLTVEPIGQFEILDIVVTGAAQHSVAGAEGSD